MCAFDFIQIQQNILLQAKQQAQALAQAQVQASQQQATNQFNKMPDQPSVQAASSTASGTIQPPVQSLLQQKSVLVKSSTTGGDCICLGFRWLLLNILMFTMLFSP